MFFRSFDIWMFYNDGGELFSTVSFVDQVGDATPPRHLLMSENRENRALLCIYANGSVGFSRGPNTLIVSELLSGYFIPLEDPLELIR